VALLALAAISALVPTGVQTYPSASADPGGKMYWTEWNGSSIRRANLDGSGIEDVVTGLYAPSGIALDVAAGKMYWAEAQGKIRRANLDGSGAEDLVTGLFDPRSIALDVAQWKMYWTEYGPYFDGRKIARANLDGSGVEDLVTDLDGPYGIALDVGAGMMYWTDDGGCSYCEGRIQRANLDGSGVQNLLTMFVWDPRGIALDVASGKMYWVDERLFWIVRATMYGTGMEQLLTLEPPQGPKPYGIALDVDAGMMYWTDAQYSNGKIQRANLDGSGVEDLVTGLAIPRGIALDLGPPPPVGGTVELRDDPTVQRDQPASGSSLPLPASVAIGLLVMGASGLYVVRMRRG